MIIRTGFHALRKCTPIQPSRLLRSCLTRTLERLPPTCDWTSCNQSQSEFRVHWVTRANPLPEKQRTVESETDAITALRAAARGDVVRRKHWAGMALQERQFHTDEFRRGKPTNCKPPLEARFWAEMIATIRWPIILQIVDEPRVKGKGRPSLCDHDSCNFIVFVCGYKKKRPNCCCHCFFVVVVLSAFQ